MKWFFSVLFSLLIYAYFVIPYVMKNYLLIPFLFVPVLIVGIVNYILAFKNVYKREVTEKGIESFNKLLLFTKLINIPFFIINFLFFLLAFIVGGIVFFPFSVFGLFTTVPLIICITYCIMLLTSAYTIPTLIVAKKLGYLNQIEKIIFFASQFIFVADIIGATILFFIINKRLKISQSKQTVIEV